MKLFKDLKKCKGNRKKYRIKPTIKFSKDIYGYCISFLPTIVWDFWIYRTPNSPVIDIWWLHYHILIGRWEKRSDTE